jgi:hypothetical protein
LTLCSAGITVAVAAELTAGSGSETDGFDDSVSNGGITQLSNRIRAATTATEATTLWVGKWVLFVGVFLLIILSARATIWPGLPAHRRNLSAKAAGFGSKA